MILRGCKEVTGFLIGEVQLWHTHREEHVFVILGFSCYMVFLSRQHFKKVTQQGLVTQHLLAVQLDCREVKLGLFNLTHGLLAKHGIDVAIVGDNFIDSIEVDFWIIRQLADA